MLECLDGRGVAGARREVEVAGMYLPLARRAAGRPAGRAGCRKLHRGAVQNARGNHSLQAPAAAAAAYGPIHDYDHVAEVTGCAVADNQPPIVYDGTSYTGA